MNKKILSILLAALLLLGTAAGAVAEHTHSAGATPCNTCGYHTSHNSWESLSDDTDGKLTLEAGKNYYLAANITVTSTVQISGGTVNLCLNGHELKMEGDGSVINIASNATLNLTDHSVNLAAPSSTEGAAGIITGGKTALGGGVYNAGTFNMSDVSITGNQAYKPKTDTKNSASYGGGVYNFGTFNMYSGSINNNNATADSKDNTTANGKGGGVFNCSNGTFNMYGGNISENYAKYTATATYASSAQGGGVFNEGIFNMSGNSSIDHNGSELRIGNNNEIFPYYGGGVYNTGTVNMSGSSSISQNMARNSGSGLYNNGSFVMNGTSRITENTNGDKGIYIAQNGSFIMNDGTHVDGNNYIYVAGAITLSGKVDFTDTILDLSSSAIINIGSSGMSADFPIEVNSNKTTSPITHGAKEDTINYFTISSSYPPVGLYTIGEDTSDTNPYELIIKRKYYISTNRISGNGNISSSISSAAPGETVTITATPDNNHVIHSVTVVNFNDNSESISFTGPTDSNDNSKIYTFKMPAFNVMVKVAFEPPSVQVCFDANGGSFENNETTQTITSYFGEKYTLPSETPTRDGYNFAGWYTAAESGNQVTGSTNVTNADNHKLYAHWTVATYTVSASANPSKGGAVSGNGQYNHKAQAELTARANAGYTFTNWTENNNEVSTAATYSFTVTEDHTLVANFTPNSHQVTVTANPTEGGTVSGGRTYSHGSNVTVEATPNDGYQFIGWFENNAQIENAPAEYSFNATQNRTLEAKFKPIQYTVTLNASAGGTASVNKPEATVKDTIIITATPEDRKKVTVTVTDANNEPVPVTRVETNKYTFVMPASDVTVDVTFGDLVVPVTGVEIDEDDKQINLFPGWTAVIEYDVFPNDATYGNITWSSSNPSVVAVEQNGQITALAPGNATITVTTDEGNFTDTCDVTVYGITKQPDTIDYTVKVHPTDASYQWYRCETDERVVTEDDAKEVFPHLSYCDNYYPETQKWSEKWGGYLAVSLNAGDQLKLEFDAPLAGDAVLWLNDESGHDLTSCIPADGKSTTYTFTATESGGFSLWLDPGSGTSPDVKATKVGVIGKEPVAGQTSATLNTKGLASGMYACEVSWGDISLFSNLVEYNKSIYAATFSQNGGSGTMTPIVIEVGDTLVLPECGFTPPAGSVFTGWLVKGEFDVVPSAKAYSMFARAIAAENETVLQPGDMIRVNGPVEITAIWETMAGAQLPKTGDSSQIMLWFGLLGLAGAGMYLLRKRACN